MIASSIFTVYLPILVALFLVVAFMLRLLWNSTFPELFGWKQISYRMACKLLLLTTILFGGLMHPLRVGRLQKRNDR